MKRLEVATHIPWFRESANLTASTAVTRREGWAPGSPAAHHPAPNFPFHLAPTVFLSWA